MIVYRLALLLLLLGTSPWSVAGLFSDDEAHRKIADLQQQVLSLEAKLTSAEATVRSQTKGLMDLVSQLDALKAEIGKLQGQSETQAHEIETTQKRQKDLYADLDGRMRKLERSGTPAAGGEPPAVVGAAPVAPAAPAADEGKTYDAALNLFKVGNYQGAIAGFQTFLGAFPSSPLAPSAHYWIGNSHFSLRDYKSAIASQQKLISQFPASSKVPDALLNVASCQQGLGEVAAARKTLEELVAKFPVSTATDLAKKRLAGMK